MEKQSKIKDQYAADVEAMASKSRFGYFSILPSHTAGITDNSSSIPHRDPDGKVHTEPRNIYSGTTSTGNLRKNYFSYTPSAFHGSPYLDPGKAERKEALKQAKKWQQKDTYKPARLNQTLCKASYEYISDTDPKKLTINRRGSDGKVITKNPNVLISAQSKIDYLKNKEFKYTECPQKKEIVANKDNEQTQKQQAFRVGSPHKDLFTPHSKTFFDADIKKKQTKPKLKLCVSHDGAFRPSCISPGKDFVPVTYKEEGQGKPQVKPVKKQNKTQEPFKLTKVEYNSRPTPSISLSKVNLLRGYR